MSYTPKTDWQYNDVLTEQDMNRIEGGISEGKQLAEMHAADQDNPHGVTVEQIGAETPSGAQGKVDVHANRTDNPHGVTCEQIGAVKSDPFQTIRSDYDAAQGLYRTVELQRIDGTLYQRAVQSNPDEQGNYQQLTIEEFDSTGLVLLKTTVLELFHDPHVGIPTWKEAS